MREAAGFMHEPRRENAPLTRLASGGILSGVSTSDDICTPPERPESMGNAAGFVPTRLCCGQKHHGVVCPDGLVQCCICFDRVPIERLHEDAEGGHVDVCLACEP